MRQEPLSDVQLGMFKPGIYLHYKGHLYEATHLSSNSSEDDRVEVAYVALQVEEAGDGPRHHTREFIEFFDWVHPYQDGRVCAMGDCGGGCRKRFSYLGPLFEASMLNTKVDDYIPLAYSFDGQD